MDKGGFLEELDVASVIQTRTTATLICRGWVGDTEKHRVFSVFVVTIDSKLKKYRCTIGFIYRTNLSRCATEACLVDDPAVARHLPP